MKLKEEWKKYFNRIRFSILYDFPEELSELLLNINFIDSVIYNKGIKKEEKIIIGEIDGKKIFICMLEKYAKVIIYDGVRVNFGEKSVDENFNSLLKSFINKAPERKIEELELRTIKNDLIQELRKK